MHVFRISFYNAIETNCESIWRCIHFQIVPNESAVGRAFREDLKYLISIMVDLIQKFVIASQQQKYLLRMHLRILN